MAKKAVIDIANDSLEDVKAYLTKLKREEAKLEIALTLREFPEFENELVRLVTCVVELSIVEKSIRLESVETNEQEMKTKQAQIQMQIDALKAKILTLVNDNDATRKLKSYYQGQVQKLELDRYSAGMTKKNIKYLEHYETLLRTLRQVYDKFTKDTKFPPTFDIFYHCLGLKKALEIADDLIARKAAAA